MACIVACGLLLVWSCKHPTSSSHAPSEDEPGPAATVHVATVHVTIVNHRKQPVFVADRSDCSMLPLQLRDSHGKVIDLDPGQILSCESLRKGMCPVAGSCPGPLVRRLPPGGSYQMSFRAARIEMSHVTKVAKNCPTACYEEVALPAGTYVAEARAYSRCNGDCACPQGVCARPAGVADHPELSASARFELPGPAAIELDFK